NYRARSKFATWLFTIANNLALNHLRARRRNPVVRFETHDSGPLGPRPAEQLLHDSGTQPVRRIQQEELAGVIRQALEQVNERQRMAVILNKYEDLNYAEIADVMGLTVKAVKSLLCRARSNLREALKEYIYMDGEPIPRMPEDP